ncbi:hypothetical protein [Haliangium sp.]|uniref:hypothetical protein n=1 Tax=Haliangium sp. TaxID=2663208 RepID=UPI003D0AC3D0
MSRVLHLVRSPHAPPSGVVAPDDVVVYTYPPSTPAPAARCRLWSDANGPDPDPACAHVPLIDTDALCALLFELDRIVVW